jgi:Bifunctional DNA primase/polymerase, N-terminal
MDHPAECGHWIGAEARYCLSGDRVRRYLTGLLCPAHTPAALAGRPEAPSLFQRLSNPRPPHERQSTIMPETVAVQPLPTLTVALAAAARGWHVFPLRPDDKRPAVTNWENRATVDLDRVRRCWTAGPYGVGIACGPSHLLVVDLDRSKPGQTPPPEWVAEGVTNGADVFTVLCDRAGQPFPGDTYTVTTGRGGTHLYFRHPVDGPPLRNTAGMQGNGLGWLVDTRAHGGYVVAAGSIVAGRAYTVLHDTDPNTTPAWLAGRLRPAPLPPQRLVALELPADRRGAYLRAAMDAEIRRVTEAPEGQRNRCLYIAAVALGQLAAGGALPADDARTWLEQAASVAGLTALEARRTVTSGLRAGAHRPRQVAA